METLDQIRANLGAISGVLEALIETHPKRQELAAKLRQIAERHEAMMLDSTVPDEVAEHAKQMILSYAFLASPI
jgi:maltose-binding protein MalE